MSVINRFMADSGKVHWQAMKWILRYLKGLLKVGLSYRGGVVKGYEAASYVDSY